MKNDKLVTFIVTYISKEIFSKVTKVFFALILIQFFLWMLSGPDSNIYIRPSNCSRRAWLMDQTFGKGQKRLFWRNCRTFNPKWKFFWKIRLRLSHWAKNVQIRGFFWSASSHIQSKYGNTTYLDTFYAVFLTLKTL